MDRTRRAAIKRIATALAPLLVLTACGAGKAATAVPNGNDAAQYVTAKFAKTLESLADDFPATEARKSKLDSFARVDDQKSDQTITAVQLGRPPARVSKNHSNRDSNEFLDSFHPAGSQIEYLLLGPVYAPLAPTPWVSMAYNGGNYDACHWEGYQEACKMLGAVEVSVKKENAAKTAKSLPGGVVELHAELTLETILKERVVQLPDRLIGNITPEMKKKTIPATIVLDQQNKLKEITLAGVIEGDGHQFEIRNKYQVLESPTENDLPKIPAPEQVTHLPDPAAVDDFYNRMGEIQSR